MGVDKAPLPFYELHFWHCRELSVGRSIHRSEGPDHCKLANEWVRQRSRTLRDLMEEYLAEVPVLADGRSGDTDHTRYQ